MFIVIYVILFDELEDCSMYAQEVNDIFGRFDWESP